MTALRQVSRSASRDPGIIVLLVAWAVAAGLFAWSVRAAHILADYAPFSWVAAAFVGAALGAVVWRIGAWAHRQLIRNGFDAKLLAHGGSIDPMAKTFENKRIYLNEFALSSKPLIESKTFIDCEIIGPANIILVAGNTVAEHQLPICDAIAMASAAEPTNGYAFRNCVFRGCSFVRISLLFTQEEFENARNVDWLRWITILPSLQPELELDRNVQALHLSSPWAENR